MCRVVINMGKSKIPPIYKNIGFGVVCTNTLMRIKPLCESKHSSKILYACAQLPTAAQQKHHCTYCQGRHNKRQNPKCGKPIAKNYRSTHNFIWISQRTPFTKGITYTLSNPKPVCDRISLVILAPVSVSLSSSVIADFEDCQSQLLQAIKTGITSHL